MSETEPRTFVYKGRTYLRPNPACIVAGLQESGIDNPGKLVAGVVCVAIYMAAIAFAIVKGFQSGYFLSHPTEQRLAVGIGVAGPAVLGYVYAIWSSNGVKRERQQGNSKSSSISWTVGGETVGRTRGIVTLEEGMVSFDTENGKFWIQRREIESAKLIEGRVCMVVPKFHDLPRLRIRFTIPFDGAISSRSRQTELGQAMCKKIESLPESPKESLFPPIEYQEILRGPRAWLKGLLVGALFGAGFAAVSIFVRTLNNDPDSQAWQWRNQTPLGLIVGSVLMCALMGVLAVYMDIFPRKMHNRNLRKKGILID